MGRNAGYLGNPNLKPEGQTVNFTKEQIEEYIKCAKDPVYFIQKYIKVVSLDKGLVPFHLFDYQEDMINKIHDNRFIIAKLPRQSGKCVYGDTEIRIRNKKTGEIQKINIKEFYNSFKCLDK